MPRAKAIEPAAWGARDTHPRLCDAGKQQALTTEHHAEQPQPEQPQPQPQREHQEQEQDQAVPQQKTGGGTWRSRFRA
ncbi:hypothetical protein G6045_32240 [Streptomyces sp. YC504]|uniref:Uncharacterized protein n=1 Tax=Streptomyces mesophilus TaxID=1775132 RepID=A0A6G4XRS5_9ACTN|nr:hypothetical protein [Streptomyces mesophilus]NGO80296.1 hypothetical protein [Streptomyces mesophilus]